MSTIGVLLCVLGAFLMGWSIHQLPTLRYLAALAAILLIVVGLILRGHL